MRQYNIGEVSDQGHHIEENHCPCCGKADGMSYGALELRENLVFYPWTCSCGAEGKEWFRKEFDGHNVEKESNERLEKGVRKVQE